MAIDFSKYKKKDEIEKPTTQSDANNKIDFSKYKPSSTVDTPSLNDGKIDFSKYSKSKPTYDYKSWYPGMPQQEREDIITPQIEQTPKTNVSEIKGFNAYYTGMPEQERRDIVTPEIKPPSKYKIEADKIQKEIDDIVGTRSFLGFKTSYLPKDLKELSPEELRKVYELGAKKSELLRLNKSGTMGFFEDYAPLDIEKRIKKQFETFDVEDVYRGEELQQMQSYQTGRLIGTAAKFMTSYALLGGAVETGTKAVSGTLASKLAPSVPYGAIGSKSALNLIKTGLSTATTLPSTKFGVEAVKDIIIGTPLDIQEGLERGLEGEEFTDFMVEQGVINIAANSVFAVGGKVIKGLGNMIVSKKEAEATFDLVKSELRTKYNLDESTAEAVTKKLKDKFQDTIISSSAREPKLSELLEAVKSNEDIITGLTKHKKNLENLKLDDLKFTFTPPDKIPSALNNTLAYRIGGETFNIVQRTDTTYKLVNKAGIEIELPRDAVESLGKVVEEIDVNEGLKKTRTQSDSLQLRKTITDRMFNTAKQQADSNGVVNMSKESFEDLYNQTLKNVDDYLLANKKEFNTNKNAFKRESIKTLEKTLGNVDEMLPKYKNTIKNLLSDLDPKKLTSKKKLRLESLKNYLDNTADEVAHYKVPEGLKEELDRLGKKSIKDLDYAEVDELVKVVKHIEHLEKTKKKLLSSIKTKTINEAVEETLTHKGGLKVIKDNRLSRLGEYVFRSGSLNLDRVTNMIGGWVDDTPLRSIYKELELGYSTKRMQHVKDYTTYMESLGKATDFETVGKQIDTNKFSSDEVRILWDNMSTQEKVEVYLNTKSAYNYKNLVDEDGGIVHRSLSRKVNLTDEDVELIVDSLTENQRSYGDMLFDFENKTSRARLNQTSVKLDGYERATMSNYHQVIPGDATMEIGQGVGKRTIEGASILKERTGKVTSIRLYGADENFKRYNEAVANYYGLAIPARDLKAVLNDSTVRESLQERFGKNILNTLDKKITDIEGGIFLEVDPVTGAMKKGIRNVQTAILGLNPKVMLNQLASIPTSWAEISPKYFSGKLGDVETITKYSPEFWDRFRGTVTRESAEALQQGRDWATVLIRKGDQKAIQTIWGAAENEVRATTNLTPLRNADEFYEAVARRTESIVHKTQPNYNTLFTSAIGSTRDSLTRMATMFSTQRNQNYQILYESIAKGLREKNMETAIKGIAPVFAGSLTIGLINKGANAWRGRESNLAANTASSFVSNAYLVGYLSNFFINGYEANNILEDSANDLMGALKTLSEGDDLNAGIKETTIALSKFTGIPIENVEREIKYALKNFRPDMYYEYEKMFKEPTRQTLYSNLEQAIQSGDTEYINSVIDDMVNEGVEYSNLKNSMEQRGISEFKYSRFKDNLR